MSKIKIESGVPAPQRVRNSYPFAEMKIGDSFAAPTKEAQYLRNAASQWKLRHPEFSYTTKTQDGTIRLWRIAVDQPLPKDSQKRV